MNIKNKLFLALLSTLSLSHCTEDRIPLNYNTVNEVSIEAPKDRLTIVQRDTLKIVPKISITDQNSGPYTYRWEMYKTNDLGSWEITPANPPTTTTLLSTERDLNEPIVLAPGEYVIQYTITDSRTKLRSGVQYPVTVNGRFYEGWIVTASKAGQTNVSFLRQDGEVFNDIIKSSNPDLQLEGRPIASFAGIQKNLEEVNVFTDKKMYRFSASDFSFKDHSDMLFEVNQTSFGQPYYYVNYVNFDQYVISLGSIYATTTPFVGLNKYSERFNGPEDYSIFPYIISGKTYWLMVYDNHGKRFLHSSYEGRTLRTFSQDNDSEAAFDLSNVGKTMVGGDKGHDGEYYLVMKDAAGYYFLSVLPDEEHPAGMLNRMLAAPDIDKAIYFAASETNKQLYYCSSNKIYLYDAVSQRGRLIYSFPNTAQIKDMKMCKGPGWGKTNDNFNKQLAVAVNTMGDGELYLFDLAPIGEFKDNTYATKYQGFGDIQHISYRIPNL